MTQITLIEKLLREGYGEQALSLCNKICERESTVETLNLLGKCHLEVNQLHSAIDAFNAAVELDPANIDAWVALANTQIKLNRREQAAEIFAALLDTYPENYRAHVSIGDVCYNHGDLDNARYLYARATKMQGCDHQIYLKLGDVLLLKGLIDLAEQAFRRAHSLEPLDRAPLTRLVQILERRKRYDEAWQLLEPMIRTRPPHPDAVNLYTILAHRIGKGTQAAALAEASLRKTNTSTAKRLLHANLGLLYDRLGEYGRAFQHLSTMNQLAGVSYDPRAIESTVESTIDLFTGSNLAAMPTATQDTGQMIFVVGMPRSGTSLIEKIISSHLRVAALGETQIVESCLSARCQANDIDMERLPASNKFNPELLDAIAGDFHQYVAQQLPDKNNYLRFIEKTPFNFKWIGIITRLFPEARIIHIKRDPLDCCLSCYMQNFADALSFSFSLKGLAHYYQNYKKLMTHWTSVLPDKILEIQYESLVHNPEPHTRKMIDYCGLEWDPQCLRHYESNALSATASYEQVRQPIYTSSVGRWRHYRDFIGDLKSLYPVESQNLPNHTPLSGTS